MTVSLDIPTPDGVFTATYSPGGLCGLGFPSRGLTAKASPGVVPGHVKSWHILTTKAILLGLAGKHAAELPPLDLSSGTPFQQKVWSVLRTIPAGQTRSYGEIAQTVGKPGACRAVGGACGANPIPVLVPCHRVLAAGKKLGGFSGGLRWKELLLEREGALPA